MRVGIYYGGRGVIEDPALYVLDIMEMVLDELNVSVERFNLYEHKNKLERLPQTIREMDGIVLATTVEWLGIGGYMTQFLDALWLYGDREKMKTLYMQPVVLSTTYGEREGVLTLENAWESLGGILAGGVCGYVEDISQFRQNDSYRNFIEKRTEDLYRTISNHPVGLPKSSQAVSRTVQRSSQIRLTPQESEQLSELAADETKVRQQKQDIVELSQLFSQMIGGEKEQEEKEEFVDDFRKAFTGHPEVKAIFIFKMPDRKQPLMVSVDGTSLVCGFQPIEEGDVVCTLSSAIMDAITAGRMTFQRAFSVGDMSVKGSFATLRQLDELFIFS